MEMDNQENVKPFEALDEDVARRVRGKSFLDSPDGLWSEQPVEEAISYAGNGTY